MECANKLRSDRATAIGRRHSLESLIRDHSYSTETVRRLLRSGALTNGMASVGTLADFIEVSGEHEGVVDLVSARRIELRRGKELGCSWKRAPRAQVRRGRQGHVPDSPRENGGTQESNGNGGKISEPGLTPLRNQVRLLGRGFGHSLETILPKLRGRLSCRDGCAGAKTGWRACLRLAFPYAGRRMLPPTQPSRAANRQPLDHWC